MKFKRPLVALSLVSAGANVQATDAHLEPVEGYFSSYNSEHAYRALVREILVAPAVDSPAAMVTLPSFAQESVVFLSVRKGSPVVVSAMVSEQIWSSEKRDKIKVDQKEKALTPELADRVCLVFALATSASRYPSGGRVVLDGTSYYFSAFVRGVGTRTGKTWSPKQESVCGRLVALGEILHRYAREETSEDVVATAVEPLLALLK